MYFDLALEELKKYLPLRQEPDDFDKFWGETMHQAEKDVKEPNLLRLTLDYL